MRYFDHSTTAASDDKVQALRLEQGGEAVDAYWAILEKIYEDEAPFNRQGNQHVTNALCHRLCTDEKSLEGWISAMLEIGLLVRDVENPDAVTSERASKNIEAYQAKCKTARENGKKGGRKSSVKPKRNRVGSDVGTNAKTESQANKTKQNKTKGFGFDKQNQKPEASDGAAAEEAAPSSAPYCPLCNVKLFRNSQIGRYECPSCHDTFDEGKAEWK